MSSDWDGDWGADNPRLLDLALLFTDRPYYLAYAASHGVVCSDIASGYRGQGMDHAKQHRAMAAADPARRSHRRDVLRRNAASAFRS